MENSNFETLYVSDRNEWRQWLWNHFDHKSEIWLIYPKKKSGKERILYNDAVEEALCVGWIDSTVKTYDDNHSMQRFVPRRKNSSYSQANKERLKWLKTNNKIHPDFIQQVNLVLEHSFEFPTDILSTIQEDPEAWKNFQNFSNSYKRIRIAYINSARKRPEEYNKRLNHFIDKTRNNQLIKGYGGIDKYY